MKVLIVDDSQEMQVTLKKILSGSGVAVACASNAQELRAALATEIPQLILLDVGLPGEDGFQLFAELQENEATRHISVIFVTGKNETMSKVAAFSLGAEDYIVKPFDHLEVKARLEARIRRLSTDQAGKNLLQRGRLQIDVAKQRVTRAGGGSVETLSLTPKEFKLLVHMAKSEETVFTRNQLMDAVWGSDSAVFDRTVDTHISSLRKKLGDCAEYVESVLGTGYCFSAKGKTTKKAA